jgi:hypothetical protein
LHLSSTSFSILRFFIAFSSQGGQYQCRSDRLVSSLYSVLLNLTQERKNVFHNIHTSTKGNALSTEGWTCKVCSVKFTEDKAEVLECEYCEKHVCRSCVKLSSTEYKLLVTWFKFQQDIPIAQSEI